jgi:phosphoribosylglycinamide formyltransferase-1
VDVAPLGGLGGALVDRHRPKDTPEVGPAEAFDSMASSMGGRAAVLVSGSGTNLQALLDDPAIAPSVVLVVSDRPGVMALERASRAGIPTEVLSPSELPDRDVFDRATVALLERHGVDAVVNAGYMRVLGAPMVAAFGGRWLNIHPSLLPAYPGAHPVRDTLVGGAKVTGVTVHLVDEGVDTGPIVLQECVPVLPGDDEVTLHERIHEVEHRVYPVAVRALLEGRIHVEGHRAWIEEG